MASPISKASGPQTRKRVEQLIRRAKPTSAVDKVAVAIVAPIAGVLAEQAVKTLEERGPEMASKGLELAKEKLPIATEKAKAKVKVLHAMIRERRSGGGGK